MANQNRTGADYYSSQNIYGGNETDPAYIKMKSVYDEYGPGENWLRERGYDPATVTDEDLAALWDEYRASEEARGMDPWRATGSGEEWQQRARTAEAANEWARRGRAVRDMERGSAADIDRARGDVLATRDARLALLGDIEGNRGDVVSPASQMAADSLLQQAAQARARGIDPSLAMSGVASGARQAATGAMTSRAQQQQAQQAALQEGAYGIRGSDLQRELVEQQIMQGDLAFRQAQEDMYMKYLQEAQSLKETGRNAEVQLANIAAGGPADYDWGEALLPAALQAGSMGLMALGSMSGGGVDKETATAAAQGVGAGPVGNVNLGIASGAQQGFDDVMRRAGYYKGY
jgi:hypothetical protein